MHLGHLEFSVRVVLYLLPFSSTQLASHLEFHVCDLETIILTDTTANKVVFCTGGSGAICSGQVKALVSLGANACIVGRNRERAEKAAVEISSIRPGSVVVAVGDVDVRNAEKVQEAVKTCVARLGGIDFVM